MQQAAAAALHELAMGQSTIALGVQGLVQMFLQTADQGTMLLSDGTSACLLLYSASVHRLGDPLTLNMR